MPNITLRTNKDGSKSYLIRVYVDETGTGHQITKSMTWRPPKNMRPTAVEKEVNRQALLFEDQVKKGLAAFGASTAFADYATAWVENEPMAYSTREIYRDLLRRILPAMGHIKLEKLQAHHLEAFYKNLAEDGISQKGNYATSDKLVSVLYERKMTQQKLSELAKVSVATIRVATKGRHIAIESAQKISKALGLPVATVFTSHKGNKKLSDSSILHYHRLISAILSKAKRERLIPYNVAAEHATAPKVQHKEAVYLDDEQARDFLSLLLSEEDIRIKTALILLLFTGVRRGELCGLSWTDIDEEKKLINIIRASQYQPHRGVVEVPTKTASSVRAIKVPAFVIELLGQYHSWWNEQQQIYGKDWQGTEQRLFIQDDGKPINPDTINF